MAAGNAFHLRLAARCVAGGGVLAYPTEAVWGLGCDPFDSDAVRRILTLKARPADKGLILVASSMDQFGWLLADLTTAQRDKLAASWPGPNTWLVPHHGRVPELICGRFDTVALRVSAHPLVSALCEAVGTPLVSTSANPADAREARSLFQARRYFRDGVDYYLPGPLGEQAKPSTIRDLVSDRVIRAA